MRKQFIIASPKIWSSPKICGNIEIDLFKITCKNPTNVAQIVLPYLDTEPAMT